MQALHSNSKSPTRHLNLDPEIFKQCLNREPFGTSHDLSSLEFFDLKSLRSIGERYKNPRDYFIAGGASSPGEKFYSVPSYAGRPAEVFDKLKQGSYRILLKRVERYDDRVRQLLNELFQQVLDMQGGLRDDRVERLESSVLVSSAATTTPFHFDPEVNFFCQIAGEKIYHVYSPAAVSEEKLEQFYFRGVVNIGQLDFPEMDPRHESVFRLGPGKGLHQPQNAPHWVETRGDLSISFTFVYETTATRVAGRARALNFYLRKLGMRPRSPGERPGIDAAKAKTMRGVFGVYLPIRRSAGTFVRWIRGG